MSGLFTTNDTIDENLLVGHGEAARQVANSWTAGRMHHAWLLTGLEGVGKATFALRMASYIVTDGKGTPDQPSANDKQAQHVLAETHPDLLVIRRSMDEKTGALRQGIVVEDALRVGAFLRLTASHGGWRVVMIDEAHKLNRNAQNAILKILEEPPSRAMIIMTATTVGAMLPTIRSRCRVLPFAPLDDQAMRELLKRYAQNLGEDESAKLLTLSGGSIGKALRILKTGALDVYEELMSLFEELPQTNVARLHKLADKIAPKAETDTFEVATELFLEKLRQHAVSAASNGDNYAVIRRKIDAWETASAILASAEDANLDRKLSVINALCALKKCA